MTLRLILIRHAKSDWGQGLDDHDRPLNDRGRLSATRIGAWLAGNGYLPDTALVSSSRRTQQTWDGIAARLPDPPEPLVSRGLYLADPAELLAAIRAANGQTLLLIAHNPGIAGLALALAEAPPDDDRFGRYPTGATTILDFPDAAWSGIAPETGQVIEFVTPRDLPDPD